MALILKGVYLSTVIHLAVISGYGLRAVLFFFSYEYPEFCRVG